MSVESQARRALWRVVVLRLLVELIDFPFEVVRFCSLFLGGIARVGFKLSVPVFMAEQDAARRYRLLTGCDLGVAVGDADRYLGSRPEAFDAAAALYDDEAEG